MTDSLFNAELRDCARINEVAQQRVAPAQGVQCEYCGEPPRVRRNAPLVANLSSITRKSTWACVTPMRAAVARPSTKADRLRSHSWRTTTPIIGVRPHTTGG